MATFDKRAEFEDKCREHLEELKGLCTMYGIPFYFTACLKNDEEKSTYITDAVLTSTTGVQLTDDQLKKHLLVGLGFDVIPHRADLEIMMDDPDMF
jgi:hypothetical protein